MLDEAPLGGDRIEDLDELGAQQHLGGDRRAAAPGVERLEGGAHALKGGVDHGADRAQRVIARHDVLKGGQHDELLLPLLVSSHRPLLIHDLQVLLYQRRVQKDSAGKPERGGFTAGPATISAAC